MYTSLLPFASFAKKWKMHLNDYLPHLFYNGLNISIKRSECCGLAWSITRGRLLLSPLFTVSNCVLCASFVKWNFSLSGAEKLDGIAIWFKGFCLARPSLYAAPGSLLLSFGDPLGCRDMRPNLWYLGRYFITVDFVDSLSVIFVRVYQGGTPPVSLWSNINGFGVWMCGQCSSHSVCLFQQLFQLLYLFCHPRRNYFGI